MRVPLILDPDTGDPVGFVLDAAGRFVERPGVTVRRLVPGGLLSWDGVGLEIGDRFILQIGPQDQQEWAERPPSPLEAIEQSEWGSGLARPRRRSRQA